jgi:hypothetical protein
VSAIERGENIGQFIACLSDSRNDFFGGKTQRPLDTRI